MDVTKSPRFLADMAVEADPSAPVHLWFLSFADGSRLRGSQFLGGLYLRAKTLSGVLVRSHRESLNPGGEMQACIVDPRITVEDRWIGRLLTREELEEQDRLASAN